MSLRELIRRDCIELDVPIRDKRELIRRMVDGLATTGLIRNVEAVTAALLERERVMSTGIGGGVAIPHAQSPEVDALVVCLVRPREGIEFDSLDEKPVRLVFMIVGPEERGGFIRILARISRLLYAGQLQERLLRAETADDVLQIVSEEEERLRA